jgi:hypothetical protein
MHDAFETSHIAVEVDQHHRGAQVEASEDAATRRSLWVISSIDAAAQAVRRPSFSTSKNGLSCPGGCE